MEIQYRKIGNNELASVSQFITRLNKDKESHVGFAGDVAEETLNYFKTEFEMPATECFIVALENKKIIGVCGFEFYNERADLYGPFVDHENWAEIADMLWLKVKEMLPKEAKIITLFYNTLNKRSLSFAARNHFTKKANSKVLLLERSGVAKIDHSEIQTLAEIQKDSFMKIHDETFPGTYFTGVQILERLNEHRKVFVFARENEVLGYTYVEVDTEFGEATIEFIGVNKSSRGLGLGKKLLSKAIEWIFSFKEIEAIDLCVNAKNEALHLYQKVGFIVKDELESFTMNI